jgi:hypothetical protein
VTVRRIAAGAGGGFVVMFFLAALWNQGLVGQLAGVRVDEAVLRLPPNSLLIIAGYASLAVIMSWLYERVRVGGGSWASRGLRFGAIVALLWMLPLQLVLSGMYNLPPASIPLHTAWSLLEQGLGGLAVAAAHEVL